MYKRHNVMKCIIVVSIPNTMVVALLFEFVILSYYIDIDFSAAAGTTHINRIIKIHKQILNLQSTGIEPPTSYLKTKVYTISQKKVYIISVTPC